MYDGSTLQSRTTYSRPERSTDQRPIVIQYTEPVEAKYVGNGPANNIKDYTWLLGYDSPYEGKEYRAEALAAGTTVARTSETNWEADTGQLGVANPVEVTLTLPETGQSSRRTMAYDQFNNRRELWEYDYGGSLKRKTVTTYVADTAYTGAAGTEQGRTSYEYDHGSSADARGNVTKSSLRFIGEARDVATQRAYDSHGNVTSVTDPRTIVTTIAYGAEFNGACPTTVTKAGRVVTAECDLAQDPLHPGEWIGTAKLTRITDANNVQTTYSYEDALDRLRWVDRAANVPGEATKIQHLYDDTNRMVTTRADLNAHGDGLLKTEVMYDTLGREVETRRYVDTSNHNATQKRYDGLGRLWQVSNPGDAGCWTTTTYDYLSRVTRVETCDGAAVTTAYAGNQATVTDEAGKRRASTSDALGRLTGVVENPGGSPSYTTTYGYDALDNLTSVTQGSQMRSFQYDSLKRLLNAGNPESGATSYTYDDNGNVLTRTDARTVVTSYSYDSFNRVLSKSYSDGATPPVTYVYDTSAAIEGHTETNYPIGRLTRVSSSASATSYRYSALGQVKASQQTTGSTDYVFGCAYNRAGGLASLSYPSGSTVTYGLDGAGRVSSVTRGTAVAGNISYTPHNALASVTLGNGLWETWSYNNRLQAESIRVGTSAGAENRLGLQPRYCPGEATSCASNNGNVLSQRISFPGQNWLQLYGYADPLNRLSAVSEGGVGPWSRSYDYDRWGNGWVTAWTGFSLDPFTPAGPGNYDAGNHLRILASDYDDPGNQRAIGGYASTHDAENRLRTSTINAATTTYSYDGEGRRVKKESPGGTWVYVYDAQGQLPAEYGPALAVGGRQYLTGDHLGSTRLVTDQAGAVVERHDYQPFGEELWAGVNGRTTGDGYVAGLPVVGAEVRFTGKERDAETGLDYFGQRYFSSAQGRFTSPDAMLAKKEWLADPQRWNKYA